MAVPTIDCDVPAWGFDLLSCLEEQKDVILIHVLFQDHAAFFRDTADRFSMKVEHDQEVGMVRFRKLMVGG